MNNAKVHDWAQEAIDKYNTRPVHQNLEEAFGYLKALRQAGNLSLELAAADHYMFMRLCSCWVGGIAAAEVIGIFLGGFGYDGVIKGFDTLVKKAYKSGLPITVGPTPTSPFSLMTIAWDWTGVENGKGDFFFRWGVKKLEVPRTPIPLPWAV
jgi:hypothetical protein